MFCLENTRKVDIITKIHIKIKTMSKSTIIVLVIVVLVIIGGIWWWLASSNAPSPAAQSNNSPSTAAGAVGVTTNQIVSTDTSDVSLNQDLANIDDQLNGLASDSANVDASMNQSTTAQ